MRGGGATGADKVAEPMRPIATQCRRAPRRPPGPRPFGPFGLVPVCLVLLLGLFAAAPLTVAAPVTEVPAQAITLTLTKAREITTEVDVREVLVADPEIADVVVRSSRRLYLIARAVGDTNAFLTDSQGRQVLTLDIRVEPDVVAVQAAIAEFVPNADVTVKALNGDLVLTGSVPSAQAADTVRAVARRFVDDDQRLLNMVEITASQQVLIRVKVAEMRRTTVKRLGINSYFQDESDFTGDLLSSIVGGFQIGGGPQATQFPDRFGSFAGNNVLPNVGGGDDLNFNLINPAGAYNQFGVNQLAVVVETLEQEGLVKTLAEPTLTAISGESASFLAGGEFPVPVGRDPDTGVVQLEFKPFGVGLSFTPVVLNSGRISMKLSTEVSELTNEGAVTLDNFTIPAVAVRRAATTVEMQSGASLVLAGLMRNDAVSTVRGVPWLATLPILGTLFRSPEFERDETELVIIATPFVVRPVASGRLSSPTDRFAPADDVDLFLLGRLYARYGAAVEPQVPDTPIGYIME